LIVAMPRHGPPGKQNEEFRRDSFGGKASGERVYRRFRVLL
jgi:hypothetical protein